METENQQLATAGELVNDPDRETGNEVSDQFLNFLENFSSENEGGSSSHSQPGQRDYVIQTQNMVQNDKTTLYIDFDDVVEFDDSLADIVESEFYRFEPFLRRAVMNLVKTHHPDYVNDDYGLRTFYVSFFNLPRIARIRELRTDRIGRLISITGTVTRTTTVRPELILGTFRCLECGTIVEHVDQQFKYTEPTVCSNQICSNRARWQLLTDRSKFADWQRIRLQESSSEIPAGSMPRSVTVILRNENVERARAGDKVAICGTLVAVPDVAQLNSVGDRTFTDSRATTRSSNANAGDGVSGLRDLGVRELTYKLSFIASSIQNTESAASLVNVRDDTEENVHEQFTAEERREIKQMKDQSGLYQRLVNCIAPSVYGHDEIKRGVLLMLFGGVHKDTKEGMKLRGDLNVCIVGDPSTAKSQFLKYVASFMPRTVYTSGKASSAAGLTASVVKDEETGEFCIEAGALMLADNGICCIDEFDKMDSNDQVAIHEAMEQQTISIAKAGIQATLNARASVLAAANPVGGRYDPSRTLRGNVALTAPILSRFDLFFIVQDECDEVTDYNIARHIVSVHQDPESAVQPDYSQEQLQRYIRFARTLSPRLTNETRELLVSQYGKIRQNDAVSGSKSSYRITVRQLESMIRLSEALARLHCDDEVRPKYVREAFRLLNKSIVHVKADDIVLDTVAGEELDGPGGREGSQVSARDEKSQQSEGTRGASVAESERSGETSGVSAAPTKISFEQYHKIAGSLTYHLRHSDTSESGMRQADLVEWYLSSQSDITSEEELIARSKVVALVIERLVHVDGVLVVTSPEETDVDERKLAVHPNYVPE